MNDIRLQVRSSTRMISGSSWGAVHEWYQAPYGAEHKWGGGVQRHTTACIVVGLHPEGLLSAAVQCQYGGGLGS